MILRKMESKRYERFKNFIRKAMGSVLVVFLCISGYSVSNVERYKVHADTFTPGQKQSFVTWLLTYFGINLYTDAQQISEELYTAVKMAYDAYLLTLQPQQQLEFDDIFDNIELIPSQPNTLKITGKLFNIMSGFRNWIMSINESVTVDDQEGYLFGQYEVTTSDSIFVFTTSGSHMYNHQSSSGSGIYNYFKVNCTEPVSLVMFVPHDNLPATISKYIVAASLYPFTYGYGNNVDSITMNNATSSTYNNTPVYYGYRSQSNYSLELYDPYVVDSSVSSQNYIQMGLDLIFSGSSGEVELKDIFALPDQAVLNDLQGATDPNEDVTIDLSDSDLNMSTVSSIADLLDQIKTLVDGYILDDSYPETIGKVIAQSVAIDNELDDVTYPNAINWDVPNLISTPQIIPLIQPNCPDLSACLVAGIQDVGRSLGNVIDSNSNVSNYVSVILFMGIALTILGVSDVWFFQYS